MDFVGNALKCYKGEFFNNKGAKSSKPKLGDCDRNAVCGSSYAETNFISKGKFVVPPGSWGKLCIDKSDLPKVSEEFGDGVVSDRCVEPKGVKVCYTKIFKSLVLSCFSPQIISILKWDLCLRKISTCRIHLNTYMKKNPLLFFRSPT